MTTPTPARPAPATDRFEFLDALRGFAIVGILLVNAPEITRLSHAFPDDPAPMNTTLLGQVLHLTVGTRFVPIFMLLFGASLLFVERSAVRRGRNRWAVLSRRLAMLLVVGIAHTFLYPGEVLNLYAIGGFLVMPLVLLLPPRAVLGLGLVGTVGMYAVTGGGAPSIPAMFLLGAGLNACGALEHLERGDRWVRLTALALVPATAVGVWAQLRTPGDPRFSTAGGVAGLLMGLLYVCVLSLLWQTAARRVLEPALRPLGRTAFSCYLGASMVLVPVSVALDLQHSRSLALVLALSVALLVVQSIASTVWLRHFRYGPLEWVWRCVTWWQRVPLAASPLANDGVGQDVGSGAVRATSAPNRR